jgi:hypothetical protein
LLADLKDIPDKNQLLAIAPLTGEDPTTRSAQVAYIKGEWFLSFLEERYGRDTFDAFLRKWFDSHAFTSQDSAEFERFLMAELSTRTRARPRTRKSTSGCTRRASRSSPSRAPRPASTPSTRRARTGSPGT